jgi:hypothetical protein
MIPVLIEDGVLYKLTQKYPEQVTSCHSCFSAEHSNSPTPVIKPRSLVAGQ